MNAPTLQNWLTPPRHREGLHRVERIVATAAISRGTLPVRELRDGQDPAAWMGQRVDGDDGQDMALDDFLTRTHTDGFLVLRGDTILFEKYYGTQTADTRHIVMSISKSACGMIAGILIADGALDETAPVLRHVPELAGTSYDGATVRQLLDMTATPLFDMSYTDPDTQVQAGDRAAGWRPAHPSDAAGTHAFLSSLHGSGNHGSAFQYCSATTDVLAWVLERAAGIGYRELVESLIWSQIGAEADAYITVDAHQTPYACAGMGMRLRDLARFGRLVIQGGIRDNRTVIPGTWIQDTQSGGQFDTADETSRLPGTYRNQWWIPGTGPGSGCLYAVGIFGQYLWLDPSTDTVIAKFSSETEPLDHSALHVTALASLSARSSLPAVLQQANARKV